MPFVYFFLHLSFSLFIRFHCFCKRKKVFYFLFWHFTCYLFLLSLIENCRCQPCTLCAPWWYPSTAFLLCSRFARSVSLLPPFQRPKSSVVAAIFLFYFDFFNKKKFKPISILTFSDFFFNANNQQQHLVEAEKNARRSKARHMCVITVFFFLLRYRAVQGLSQLKATIKK